MLALQLIRFSKIGLETRTENLVYMDIQNFYMVWPSVAQTQDTISF